LVQDIANDSTSEINNVVPLTQDDPMG